MSKLGGFPSGNSKRVRTIVVVAMLVVAGTAAGIWLFAGNVLDRDSKNLFEVHEMDLHIVISEQGVLQAKNSEKIIPNIDSEAKIISITEEGDYVRKGDKLVELDKSGIEVSLELLELDLIIAKADMDVSGAEVKKYEDGEYPQKMKELGFAIEKAKAKLQKAEDEMPKEASDDIYSASEIRDAEIAFEEAKMNLEKAKLDKKIYEEYTDKKNRLEKKTEADTAKEKYVRKLAQKKDLEQQLKEMILFAPCNGLVIYGGSSGSGRRRLSGDEAEIKVGAVVYKKQVIITLPNVSKMQVQVPVHEVDIEKVNEKQKVNVSIDAFPNMKLTGEVTNISSLARERDGWRSKGVKVFDITIDISGEYKRLRPGMTANVDIQVKTIKSVLAIPIEAVFDDPEEKQKYCFVRKGGGPKKRIIELGESDDNYVVVLEGLEKGELVYQYDVLKESGI